MTMRMQLVKKPTDNAELNVLAAEEAVGSKAIIGEIIRMHKELVEPWELAEDTPDFVFVAEAVPGGTILYVEMRAESAEQATLSVWQLLNREEGTEVRPMHVSRDWESKTSVRGLSSGPGAGRTTGIYKPWADGIEGRIFDVTVAEDAESRVDAIVYKAYEDALTREFAS